MACKLKISIMPEQTCVMKWSVALMIAGKLSLSVQ